MKEEGGRYRLKWRNVSHLLDGVPVDVMEEGVPLDLAWSIARYRILNFSNYRLSSSHVYMIKDTGYHCNLS